MRQIDTYWQGGSQSNSRTLSMTDNLLLAGMYAQIELDIDLEDKVYTTDGTSVLKHLTNAGGIDHSYQGEGRRAVRSATTTTEADIWRETDVRPKLRYQRKLINSFLI
jgi:hypothetical protein